MSWLKAIQSHLVSKPDPIPKGWKTSIEISKELGCSPCTAQRKIKVMKSKGLVDTQEFMVQGVNKLYPVPHYKLKLKP